MHIAGIDYGKFKLFLLSLIWRVSVSKHSFFSQVDLGPHEELIRLMLRQNDPGPHEAYPTLIFALSMEPGVIPDVLIQPTKSKNFGHTTYHLVIPGLKFVFFVSNHGLPRALRMATLQQNGSAMIKIANIVDLPALRDFMEKFDQQGRTARL